MKRFEVILFVIYFLFAILAYFDVPGMEPLMIITYSITGLTYLIFSFILFNQKHENVNNNNLIISIIGGFFMFLTMLGTIFKQMLWPGSFLMLVGLFSLILMMIPICVYKYNKGELRTYYKFAIIRFLLVSSVAVVWYIIPSDKLENHRQERIESIELKNSY